MKRYGDELLEDIKKLRSKGLTYAEIQKQIGVTVPKSSLSYICRSVRLPASYKEHVTSLSLDNLKNARALASLAKKKSQAKFTSEAQAYVSNLISDEVDLATAKIALAMLYLGEGSKSKSYRGLALGSSDPLIVNLYIKLLKVCFDIDSEKLRAKVLYRVDQNLEELINYWSRETGLSTDQFYITSYDPRTKKRPTKNVQYKGVCVISCAGTRFQLELQVIADILFNRIKGI